MAGLLDTLQSGDVLGMIAAWADVFNQAGKAFIDAFTFSPDIDLSSPEAAAGSVSAALPSIDFSTMAGPLGVLALVWLAFMLLTHTAAWKRITEWKMPMWACVVLAAPMGLFAVASFCSFVSALPLEAIGGAVLTFLLFAAALPLFAGLAWVGEKVVVALNR